MKSITYREIEGRSAGYYALLGGLTLMLVMGLFSAHYMDVHGHVVTGMNNQILWGIPHVFAVFLIVAASGALNVASIASVFGKSIYKPLAPLSGLLAIALLAGGLAILVLDLGRPERLIVAMTHYNFKSIFAWNVFLYTGFLAIVLVYLWTLMERRMQVYSKSVGTLAFLWRLLLTTGTGSIFGFLVAREAYDSALLAPMFVAFSFSYGLAVYTLVLMAIYDRTGWPLGDALLLRLKNLQAIFIATALYFVLVYHLTNLYFTRLHGFERFLLVDGGVHTFLFWVGQILLGSVLPLILLFHPRFGKSRPLHAFSAVLVIVGGFAQMFVTIIGGQAYPLELFPGMLESSSFYDGVINSYAPSLPEIMLGMG
ncbi:MAG: NrfD/PsrC family molybdoenzyme membrane anchor subunit, partial [Methylocella sp.]